MWVMMAASANLQTILYDSLFGIGYDTSRIMQ